MEEMRFAARNVPVWMNVRGGCCEEFNFLTAFSFDRHRKKCDRKIGDLVILIQFFNGYHLHTRDSLVPRRACIRRRQGFMKGKQNMFDTMLQWETGLVEAQSDRRAINALMKHPALSYMRSLRRLMDEDPDYLIFHNSSIRQRVRTFLSNQGICWDDAVLEREFRNVVMEAVTLLRGIEK